MASVLKREFPTDVRSIWTDMYDEKLRRRINTAVTRDKRGVRSLEYKLSMVSDNLLEALQRRRMPSKIPVWTVIMKLSLSVQEELVSILPDITDDLVQEIVEPTVPISGRNYRPKLIILLSQSMLLRPNTTYEQHWKTLLPALRGVVAESDVTPNALWSVELLVLSVISRYKKDLGPIVRDVLPLVLQATSKSSHLDKDTLIFGIKLLAAFQSHCNRFIGGIGELLDHMISGPYKADTTVLTALVEFLGHLTKWINLFEISIAVQETMKLAKSLEESQPETRKLLQEVNIRPHVHVSMVQMLTKAFPSQIRSALVFCPEIPQQQGPSLYPDFRDYTDAQFLNLALQPQERAHCEFNVHLWKFNGDDEMDYFAWQQWQWRLEHSILASCQVDVFLIACSVFPEIPRGFLQSAFVSLWDLLEAKHKVRVASLNIRY